MKTDSKRSFFSVSKSEKAALVCFAILLVAIGMSTIIPHTRLNPAHRQAELEYKQLHERLQLGMTLAQVKAAFTGLQPEQLKFHESDGQTWITTPFLLSARNWRMTLQFNQDRLIRVHSQIVDFDAFPEGAPPDKSLPQ